MMKAAPQILKASGETESFEPSKVRRSLERSGADEGLIEKVVESLSNMVVEGTTTRQLYGKAFAMLRREKTRAAYKYKLKQAVLQLGDSGYPFEHLVAEVFERQGYEVAVGRIVQGHCISHEIDVRAEKAGELHFMECKFSPNRKKMLSIQTALYVKARMDDVLQALPIQTQVCAGWLVSNMRFSADSIAYASCTGLKLLSWEYPENRGLRELLDQHEIFPITLLNYLNRREKEFLIGKGYVSCRSILRHPEILEALDLTEGKRNGLLAELRLICEG
jgi:hypothetical protein